MLTLSLTFLAGRYHSTPWGRHVNEADVAWPPDAWRLSRALIATWHRKLDKQRFAKESLECLLAALAEEAPHYQLPIAVHAHTRHYMPNRQKSTLIFDAFACINPDHALIMHWPTLILDNEQTELLDELLNVLDYLGRAESWVEAKRLLVWGGKTNCWPGENLVDIETGEVKSEPIPLLLPLPREEYAVFQSNYLQQIDTESLTKKERDQLTRTLQKNWLDAISLDTAELQSAGWSAPPAARKLLYQRPIQALRSSIASETQAKPQQNADTVRYAIYGKPLARVEDTLKFAEWLRTAVLSKAKCLLGADNIPALLSGHGLPDENSHNHAFFIPESDAQGRITHVVIHVPGGFTAEIRLVLEGLNKIWNRDGQKWQLIMEYIGGKDKLATSIIPFKQSVTWQSATPYLHPWHCKKTFDIEAQIRRECRERGLPEVVSLERKEAVAYEGRNLRSVDFHRFRRKRGLTQPDTHGSFWTIIFSEPVSGPILLGFACHFGLGLFIPNM